jgi:ProP effector
MNIDRSHASRKPTLKLNPNAARAKLALPNRKPLQSTTATAEPTSPSWRIKFAEIAARFPTAFAEPRRPLKVGIREDIIAAGFEPRVASRFLYRWTHKPRYLRNLIVGAERIDLNGEPAGIVAEDEATFARERVELLAAEKLAKAAKRIAEGRVSHE